MTAMQDRTAEFVQTIRTIRNGRILKTGKYNLSSDHKPVSNGHIEKFIAPNTSTNSGPNAVSGIKARSQFTLAASAISRDLTAAFTKLEKLNSLALQRRLFDDHNVEINQITMILKDDISRLNRQIRELQELAKLPSALQSFGRPGGKQLAIHSSSVLTSLQSRLARVSTAFKTVLERRSESLKAQARRRGHYLDSGSAPDNASLEAELGSATVPAPPLMPTSTVMPSILLQDEERARVEALRDEDMALAIPGLARPFNIQHQHQLQLLRGDENLLIDANQSYYSARANAMLNIEHTIVELGEIFQQLATMVHEQDESVRRIDANLDEASTRIEAGHSELVKYLQSISSNRWLIFKVFGVLVIFLLIFIFFIV